jgi:inner membrane protein
LDSITQAALGACVTAVCVPREHRRKALVAGAMLGTVPDLDVFIDFGDAVSNFTYHRGFSHSLFVLPGVALLIWLALRRWWAPVREAPRPWLWGILLALITHPLLDAHTAYGTQLFWPIPVTPTSWSTLFIIDPLYTLPLLVGVIAVAGWAARPRSHTVLAVGLALSTAYIGWSWMAKGVAEHHAREVLAQQGIEDPHIFSAATPLNTFLWRVVVRTDEGYLEGLDSLLVDEGPMQFREFVSDEQALAEAGDLWAVQRLRWFADDFITANVIDDRLVISDLRMGQAPNWVFRHAVAERGNPHWKPIPSEQVRTLFAGRDLAEVWHRLLNP